MAETNVVVVGKGERMAVNDIGAASHQLTIFRG